MHPGFAGTLLRMRIDGEWHQKIPHPEERPKGCVSKDAERKYSFSFNYL